jgi:hypothetical protein
MALHTFRLVPQATSLLPVEFRAATRRRQSLLTLQAVALGLLLVVAIFLAAGTWQKSTLVGRKNKLLAQAESAVEAAKRTELLNRKIITEYQHVQPALDLEKHSLETLLALDAIQQIKTNRPLWFVLLADQQTYFTAPLRAQTNAVPPTNEVVSVATNLPPARRGFVAELCILENPEAARRTLSQIVAELKQHPVFRNVDTLPPDARRPLADPKLLLPDKYFSLSLELAESPFPETLPWLERAATALPRETRAAQRTFRQKTNSPPGEGEVP